MNDPVASCIWAGRGGALMPIRGVAPESFKVTGGPDMVTQTTVGGRGRAQRIRRPRAWEAEFKLVPLAEMTSLVALARGDWGNGPFSWVMPDMMLGNMLPPESVALPQERQGYLPGGPLIAEGDIPLPGSLFGSGGEVEVGSPVPVMVDVPVTLSAWVSAPWVDGSGVEVKAVVLDAAGRTTQTESSGVVKPQGLQRVSVTLSPTSVAAVSVQLVVKGALAIAGPAITWTDTLMPFTHGLGVGGVVISGATEIATRYGSWNDGPMVDISVQAREVG